MAAIECGSLDEVRAQIDRIDRGIVELLAERSDYVRQAVRFKRTAEEARAPARFEQVITQVRALALELQADPDMVEQVYRAMIGWFIDQELRTLGHDR